MSARRGAWTHDRAGRAWLLAGSPFSLRFEPGRGCGFGRYCSYMDPQWCANASGSYRYACWWLYIDDCCLKRCREAGCTGHCTHRRPWADAAAVAERAVPRYEVILGELVMRTLAAI